MADIRQTPQFTTFFGPNEDPLRDSDKWGEVPQYDLELRRLTNTATSQDHPTALSGYIAFSYFKPITVRDDNWEVWACVEGGQLGAALETWRLAVWSDPISLEGYVYYFGGGLSKDHVVRRYGRSRSDFVDIAGVGFSGYPDLMLLRKIGDEIQAWSSTDDGANWTMQLAVSDPTFHGPFFISLGIEDPSNGGLSFSCFGGGQINNPEFLLWMPTAAPEVPD